MDPKFLQAGGKRLEYLWIGRPPPDRPWIVMLHEGLGSVSHWRDFPGRLASTTGCAVLVYSRAGYGRSDPADLPRRTDYLEREALDVLPAVLDRFGIRRAVLVGHSDGTAIAMIHAAADRRRRIAGIVAMAPRVRVEPHGLAGLRQAGVAFDRGDLRERLAPYHDDADLAFRGWHDAWTDPAFHDWSIAPHLPRIRSPMLGILGDRDEYLTSLQLDLMESESGGPVDRLILQAGHAPHRDQTGPTLKAIKDFIQDLPTR